jgi:hypothetical protein
MIVLYKLLVSYAKKCTVVCLQVVATAAFGRHIALICDIITRRSV